MEPTDLSFWNVITLQVTFFAVCTTNYFKTLRESAGMSMGSVGVPFYLKIFVPFQVLEIRPSKKARLGAQ